jgi:hypothetical protein
VTGHVCAPAAVNVAEDDMSRSGIIAYWLCTVYIAVTSLVAGVLDLARAQPLWGELVRLGYPPHFGAVLGTWKVLGALALVAPRRPLLKEWAYAGLFVDFSGAIVAHAAAGDGVGSFVGPLLSIAALVGSWSLRPRDRRLVDAQVAEA